MNPGDPRILLDRHASRILAAWRDHLRALPPSSALATPELLNPLMAPALALVRQQASHPTPEDGQAPQAGECQCGLNPLVAFYLTGECATFDVLWAQPDALASLSPPAREDLCLRLRIAWQRVASAEISLFCSLCQRGEALRTEDHHAALSTPPTEPGRISGPAPGAYGAARSKAWATGRRSVGTHD